ncbi:MAG: hypothetical protein DA405_11180 [Bacteroidetes bacterium]|nr:MAG: hypothetical protein DA405_11180 [Bacteroidota bacterium]
MIKNKAIILKVFLFFILTPTVIQAQRQDTLVFMKSEIFTASNPLKVAAGETIVLGAGVTLIIENGLELQGTQAAPIVVMSQDSGSPGIGIKIRGQEQNETLHIQHVVFRDLSQALRFEPFWDRKSVNLENLIIKGGNSGDPVLYVADPFRDLRNTSGSTSILLNDITLSNNASGILLEGAGVSGLNYSINNLIFRDNYLATDGQSLLHVDIEAEETREMLIGNLVYERNRFGGSARHVSIGSNLNQSLIVSRLYADEVDVVLYDQRFDSRLGIIELANVSDLTESQKSPYQVIAHKPGLILALIPNISILAQGLAVEDSLFNRLVSTSNPMGGDSLKVEYSGEKAHFLTLPDGYKIVLPAVDSRSVLDNEGSGKDGVKTATQVDSIAVNSLSEISRFTNKADEYLNRNTSPIKEWEVGLWGGGAVYGAGDIKPKFPLIDNFLYIPSTIDWSFGLYAQYNINTRYSVKASFYHSTIGVHNLESVGVFSGSAQLEVFDEDMNLVKLNNRIRGNYNARFTTHIALFDLEGIWHLRPNKYSGQRGLWDNLIPSLGLSLGALHYTPYRTNYQGRVSEDEGYFSMFARQRDYRIKLRDLGSEGQYFIPGAEPYSVFALQIGASFALAWKFENWSLKGEVRGAYTSTDYLDDYGPGVWYGGNVQAVRDNHQVEFSDDMPADMRNVNWATRQSFPRETNSRSTDGLNDWYYQGHLGVSFNLDYLLGLK